VLPRLQEAGWSSEQIIEQYPITHGRIAVIRGKHRRGDPLRADYLLEIAPGFPVAVVEAKREYRLPSDGLFQVLTASNWKQASRRVRSSPGGTTITLRE